MESKQDMSQETENFTANNNLSSMINVPVLDDISEEKEKLSLDYSYATGRRKTSTAKIWLSIDRNKNFSLEEIKNSLKLYFSDASCYSILQPLIDLDERQNFSYGFGVKFRLIGGGKQGQSDALKLALSKALALMFTDLRCILRKKGYLTSDSRRKEREHPGYRTSRKPQQYSRR